MAGIPVYTSSPINTGSKASGITPQTSATNPRPGPPTTTATASTSSYPPAQPGAAPGPAPTGSSQRYIPLQPTPTTREGFDGPPPPQPGAVPIPLSKGAAPPPKAGEKYHPPPTQPPPQHYPAQMSLPPPQTPYSAQPPSSSTRTSTTSASLSTANHPVPITSSPRRSLEHPPGYHQDAYASEQRSGQRRAQDSENATGMGAGGEGGIDVENMWNTARQWASTAGTKIQETEAEIWRRINKQ